MVGHAAILPTIRHTRQISHKPLACLGEHFATPVTLPYGRGGRPEEISLTIRDAEVSATTSSADLTPYASEYEGYMGNYGNTLDRWYRRAALVIWPRHQGFANRAKPPTTTLRCVATSPSTCPGTGPGSTPGRTCSTPHAVDPAQIPAA
jgi:hypothetical protein